MSLNQPSFTVTMVDFKDLQPSPWNPNVVSPDNEAKLEESIRRHGFFKPVLVRQLENGSLQIIGGEHRARAAARIGHIKTPVINLGKISDKKAQELCLLDNGRYGTDDTLQLAGILEELGSAEDLSKFMPYTDADLHSIFSSVNIALDDLGIGDDGDDAPQVATKERPVQTEQIMRFKVQVEDAGELSKLIERVMKSQKMNEKDALRNAGDALVYICQHSKV